MSTAAQWLIEQGVGQMLNAARDNAPPTSTEQLVFAARAGRTGRASTREGVAEIKIDGVLTKHPNLFVQLVAGANTAYSDIQAALEEAHEDPSVTSARLLIDSPGGQVSGLFETLAAIENFRAKKPIEVLASAAQSAAYAIAAAAGPIVATTAAATFGSVGVAVSYAVTTDKAAIEQIDLTNTGSPDKRPDPRTKAGKAVITRELDAIADLLVGAIATGRGMNPATVLQDFGRGASFLAAEAQQRNMIDSVREPSRFTQERETMNLEAFKAQYPEAAAAWIAEGVAEERDRILAHLTMGEQSGAMKTACTAIRDGSAMTKTLQATYMSAAMNRGGYHSQVTARTLAQDEDFAEKAISKFEELMEAKSDRITEVKYA